MRFASAAAMLVFFLPALALAQALPTSLTTTGAVPNLTLDLSPQYPAPYSTATLTPESTLLDLADGTMTVSVNGVQQYSGNASAISIPINGPGQIETITANVTSAGQSYSQSLSVNPADVSIIEEPNATAPALYQGEPLVPASGSVRLVAMADLESGGTEWNPSALEYTWNADGTTLDDNSGIGKDTLLLATPLAYRTRQVTVTVATPDGSVVGQDSITVSPEQPIVRIYADDPLLGILFDQALGGSYKLTGSEETFFGVPYSFSTDSGDPSLSWFINGSESGTGSALTVRPSGSGAGVAAISLTGENAQTSEDTSASISLSYGSSSTGLLGL